MEKLNNVMNTKLIGTEQKKLRRDKYQALHYVVNIFVKELNCNLFQYGTHICKDLILECHFCDLNVIC